MPIYRQTTKGLNYFFLIFSASIFFLKTNFQVGSFAFTLLFNALEFLQKTNERKKNQSHKIRVRRARWSFLLIRLLCARAATKAVKLASARLVVQADVFSADESVASVIANSDKSEKSFLFNLCFLFCFLSSSDKSVANVIANSDKSEKSAISARFRNHGGLVPPDPVFT